MIETRFRRFTAAALSCIICFCAVASVSVDTHAADAQTGYTYSSQLTPTELGIYNRLGEGMKAVTPVISIPIAPPVDVSDSVKQKAAIDMTYRAYEAYYRDHPEVFWVVKSAGIKTTLDIADNGVKKEATGVNITIGYFQPEQVPAKQQELEAAVAQILKTAPATALERIQYIHDTLTQQCEYDMAAKNNPVNNPEAFEAYGALIKKKAVCEGYAKSFKLLCDRLKIPCVLVVGVSTGEKHMWNYVQLDGKYYLVDATFDDPVGGTPNTKYLLRGKQSTTDHIPSGGFIDGFSSGLTDPVLNDTDHPAAADSGGKSAAIKNTVKPVDRSKSYKVSYSRSQGGSYAVEFSGGASLGPVDSGQAVAGGINLTVRAKPNPGYTVGEIKASMGTDTASVADANILRFGVTGNCVITVTFKKAA